LLATVASGCSTSYRDRAIREFRDQLVDEAGLDKSVASCVVDAFFDGMSTDEVREFFRDPDLTDTESARFADLGVECGDGP
jgi:hypothetical protein